MIRIIFFILFSISSIISSAQPTAWPGKPGTSLTEKQEKMDVENRNCIHQSKYTPKQRKGFYPFNIARRIELVSFGEDDTTAIGSGIPKKGKTIDQSRLKEVVVLTPSELDSLTDLIYNVGYKGPFFSTAKGHCYQPRNAILFLNSTGEVFEYLEICFECHAYKISNSKISTGEFCDQKYYLIKEFFKKSGINYGTKDEDPEN